ncbi:MAG: SDR family oxidoreductase [Candidatus Paracaedibacter sp.]
MPCLFIFGLGYVGQHLGRALLAKGWRVRGTTRTAAQAQSLKDQGFEAAIWDGLEPYPHGILQGVTHILVTIPPDVEGDIVLQHLDPAPLFLKWVGYLSATSVYGDHQGAWVKEDSALNPVSPRGQQRFMAEAQWQSYAVKHPPFPIHIFRLSGIYGSGRSVLESIKTGAAMRIHKPGQVFSRIHIEDIVQVLMASITHPQPGGIYNLADDEPAATADVIAFGCNMLGVEVPPLIPFEEATISPSLREFYAEQKRICNHKIKESLSVSLIYPTYKEGLRHC